MRVTQNMIAESFMRNMYQNLSRLGDKNDRISSQRKIRRPSDDPVGTALAMRLRRQLAAMDQYKSNAEDAITWLKDTESALTNTGDIIHRLSDLTIQAANGTLTPEDREQIWYEVKELKEQLLQEANSTHVDRYLFSGYHVDEQPFIEKDGEIILNSKIKKPNDVKILSTNGKTIVDESQFVMDEIEGLEPGIYKLDVTSDTEADIRRKKTEQEIKDEIEKEIRKENEKTSGEKKTREKIENEVRKEENIWVNIKTAVKTEDDNNPNKVTITDTDGSDKKFKLTLLLDESTIDGNEVTFEITPGDMDYHLGRNDLMTVNLQGREIFEEIFENVQTLENALDPDKDIDSSELSGDILANIKGSLNHVLKYRSQVGARSKRLEMTVNKMEANYVDYKDLLSKTEDLDMAKASVELKIEESVYRAALSVGARIIQPNLADFLR